MSLKEIGFKISYSSESDDILNDFYIPVLEESIEYLRLSGYFSSSSFALAARGILGLINKKGTMKLIISPVISRKDLEIIIESKQNPEKYFEEEILKDLSTFENKFIRDHIFALGWMIANNRLEIKIAIPQIFDSIKAKNEDFQGIFHQKVGIFKDDVGNIVTFSGSINETYSGWSGNIEEFKVFWNWDSQLNQYVKQDIERFYNFWENNSIGVKVIDIPEAIEKKLVQIAPENISDLRLEKWDTKKTHKPIFLRDYQKNAIKLWLDNNKKGIFEMATGTGKTFTALGCIKKVISEEKRTVIVITCPFIHLIDQWKNNILKFGLTGKIVHGRKWREIVSNSVLDFNLGYTDNIILLMTNDIFCSEYFIEAISKINGNLFLIGDEMHYLGSKERQKGLLNNYNFRLGLSATPTRWFDDEGTNLIKEYFGKTIFEFDLEAAIHSGYLSPYEYHPHFIEFTKHELEEYLSLSKRIANKYAINQGEVDIFLEQLLFIRQNLVKNAVNKYAVFIDLLTKYKDESHCLVYCSPQQIDRIQGILNEKGILNHRFTAHENAKERVKILNLFESGTYSYLVAMNCLDEGVDVPATKIAIILASSGNPRQYIQRRGRILRPFPGKNEAIIHDFIVIPKISKYHDPSLFELERKILKKELIRYEEFAKTALNRIEAINKIYPYLIQLDVYGA